jgi:hypothetical protein
MSLWKDLHQAGRKLALRPVVKRIEEPLPAPRRAEACAGRREQDDPSDDCWIVLARLVVYPRPGPLLHRFAELRLGSPAALVEPHPVEPAQLIAEARGQPLAANVPAATLSPPLAAPR